MAKVLTQEDVKAAVAKADVKFQAEIQKAQMHGTKLAASAAKEAIKAVSAAVKEIATDYAASDKDKATKKEVAIVLRSVLAALK